MMTLRRNKPFSKKIIESDSDDLSSEEVTRKKKIVFKPVCKEDDSSSINLSVGDLSSESFSQE